MRRSEENVANAGLIFMFSVWLQGQMSDLLILKSHPELVPDFVANPKQIPSAFSKIRVTYWAKDFGVVKTEFAKAFSNELTDQDIRELDEIYHIRNMIAHAHVSFGREYMLYRPKDLRKEKSLIDALNPSPVENQSDPLVFLLDFQQGGLFERLSDQIGRLDQECFARLSAVVGIPHGRIR